MLGLVGLQSLIDFPSETPLHLQKAPPKSFIKRILPISPLCRGICAQNLPILMKTRNFEGEGEGVPSTRNRSISGSDSSVTLFPMRFPLSLLCLLAFAGFLFAQSAKPVADRLAAQNALFEEQYESDLKYFPERATAFGDYRYNDKLADYSLEAIAQRNKTNQEFLVRLQAIDTTGFGDQDQLSHDLMVRVLQQRITDYTFKEYEMPINQQNGIHTGLADMPLSMPFTTVKQYEDYIARLKQIPRVLTQTEEVLKAGMKDGLMPVRFLLEKIPAQCEGIIAANPFLLPTKKYPASISPEDQKRLTQQVTDAINNDVI